MRPQKDRERGKENSMSEIGGIEHEAPRVSKLHSEFGVGRNCCLLSDLWRATILGGGRRKFYLNEAIKLRIFLVEVSRESDSPGLYAPADSVNFPSLLNLTSGAGSNL